MDFLFDVFFEKYETSAPLVLDEKKIWPVRDERIIADFAVSRVKLLESSAGNAEEQCEKWMKIGLHPHILQLYDNTFQNGYLYAAHEWHHGQMHILRETIADDSFYQFRNADSLIVKAFKVGEAILSALSYAHAQGLFHSALNSGCVYLMPTGVKIGDFWSFSAEQNSRDVQSFAMIMLELLCGQKCARTSEEALAHFEEIRQKFLCPVPEGFAALLRDCLQDDAPDAFEAWDALYDTYHRYREQEAYQCDFPLLSPEIPAESPYGHINNAVIGSRKFRPAEEFRRALELAPDNAIAVYYHALENVLSGNCTPSDVMDTIKAGCNEGTQQFLSKKQEQYFVFGGMECLCKLPDMDVSVHLDPENPSEHQFSCEDGSVFSAAYLNLPKGLVRCVWKTADGAETDAMHQPVCENAFGKLVKSGNYIEYVEKATGRRLRLVSSRGAASFSPSGEYLGIAMGVRFSYRFMVFRTAERLKEPERRFFYAPYPDRIQEYNYLRFCEELQNSRKYETASNYSSWLYEMSKDLRISASPAFAIARRKLDPYIKHQKKHISTMLWEKQISGTVSRHCISPDGAYSAAVPEDGRTLYLIWNQTGEVREYTTKTGQDYTLQHVQFEKPEKDSGILTLWYQAADEARPDYCETYTISAEHAGMIGYETDETLQETAGQEAAADGFLKELLPDYDGVADDHHTLVLARSQNIIRLYAVGFHHHLCNYRTGGQTVPFDSGMSLDYSEEILPAVISSEPAPDAVQPAPEIPQGKSYLNYLGEMTKKMKRELSAHVFGQENAVNAFSDAWFNAELLRNSTKKSGKPRAIFTFAGPPGVGKTLLAETAARILGRPFRKFDMSSYSERDSLRALSGFEFTFRDSASGVLTKYVLQNPECVLIFDEIEKASPRVLKLFLQMLDRGEMEDLFYSTASQVKQQKYDNPTDKNSLSQEDQMLLEKYIEAGNKVSFRDAIIIFTTNTAKKLYENSGSTRTLSPQTIVNAIGEDIDPETGSPYFSPEFVSRMASGTILMFAHLRPHDLISIEQDIFRKLSETLEQEYQIQLILGKNPDDAQEVSRLLTALLLSVGGIPDARRTESYIGSFVRSQLQRAILESGLGEHLCHLRFEMPSEFSQTQIRDLFIENERPAVLVYGRQKTYADIRKSCPSLDVYYADTAVEASVMTAQKNIQLALVDIFYPQESVQQDTAGRSVMAKGAKRFRQGTEVIHSLQKSFPDLPVYLLQADEEHSYESNTLRSYLDSGVRGMTKAQPADIIAITETLYMQSVAENLARTQKVLHYETRLKVDETDGTVRVILSDFALDHAPNAADRNSLVAPCERPKDRFEDIIGAESAKKELRHIAAYLSAPAAFQMQGYPAPTGVLLYGAPGTGKTMLARACASESNVSFIATQGSILYAKGSTGVREIFSTARRNAPCIIFIDEIDSIGKQRTGQDSYRETVLNTLLAEMDGFYQDTRKPVVLIAATNADLGDGSGVAKIDEALARRFSKTIKIEEPREEDRKALLKLFTGGKLSEDELETYAGMTIGFSPAEIKKIVMSAIQEAIEAGRDLNGQDIENAIEYQLYGGEAETLPEEELRRTAWHEIGHTLCHIYAGYMPLYVTIVSRSGFGGYMSAAAESLKSCPSRRDILLDILTYVGGRAGESIYFDDPDDITTGASEDLYRATRLAYDMISRFGLADGLAVYRGILGEHPHAREFVNTTLQNQLRLAKRIIRENLTLVNALVDALCQKRRLTGKEVQTIADRIGFHRPAAENEKKDGDKDETV